MKNSVTASELLSDLPCVFSSYSEKRGTIIIKYCVQLNHTSYDTSFVELLRYFLKWMYHLLLRNYKSGIPDNRK